MSKSTTSTLFARSILFVPADQPELAEKAARSSADAICFDLEDAVTPSGKQKAREMLGKASAVLVAAGKPFFVRVNSELELTGADFAALPEQCNMVVLPKATGLNHIALLGDALDRIAAAGGPDAGLIAMIETVGGLADVTSQAGHAKAHHRLRALFLGPEDLAAGIGCSPNGALILTAFHNLAVAAGALGVELLGFPGSLAEFRDLDKVRHRAEQGRTAGATGAFCIHPAQIDVLNSVFSPDEAEVVWARAVIAAFEKARDEGSGVASHEGRMIDLPIYLRAERIMSRVKA
jgi:citrate lyase subunit beta/citryl-CoA lyase